MWLIDNNHETISKNSLMITDRKKYDEARSTLKDTKKYIELSRSVLHEYPNDSLGLRFADASFRRCWSCEQYAKDRYILRDFENPRPHSLGLLNLAQISSNYLCLGGSLLPLFQTGILHKSSIIKQPENEFEAIRFVEKLQNSSLSSEELHYMIGTLWPDFHFFATEILSCIEFVPAKQYSIKMLQDLKETSEKQYIEVLENIELAKNNSKVLKLARQIKNR